jgi:hypothetical protein
MKPLPHPRSQLRRRLPTPACITLVALCVGCGQPDAATESPAQGPPDQAASGNFPGKSYERNFVFTTLGDDSTFVVPWFLETTTRPGTVIREARGWLNRSGTWEAFYAEQWETPPTRVPARVLPYGSLRFVVREGDAVDGIIFDEGLRNLEVALGDVLTEWAGPRGEVFQLLEGSLYLADQRVGGVVLDMARGSSAESPPGGDWAFLTSGDSLQLVLEGTSEHDADSSPTYLAWARLDFRDLQWADLAVDWTETSAFQPARRDVPTSWTISRPDGDVHGVLEVTSANVTPGSGDGPVLPVRALFEVAGTIVIEGRTFPVRGLFTHERR